jgi:hypothetical protein
MSDQLDSHPTQDIAIQLEIVAEDADREDVADVDEVARGIVDHIRNSGYTVKPKYTGKMGGPVFDIFMQAGTMLYENREVIVTAAASLECVSVTLELIKRWSERHKEARNPLPLAPTEIEITIPTTTGSWTIKAPDVEKAIETVKQLPATEPEKVKKITSHSPHVKTSVARRRRRHHH